MPLRKALPMSEPRGERVEGDGRSESLHRLDRSERSDRSDRSDRSERADPPAGERQGEAALDSRLVTLFLLGCIGFAGPLLRIASQRAPAGAWPVPFLFLYGFWLVLILLLALALRSRRGE